MVGATIYMNENSNFNGQKGIILAMEEDKSGFTIQLESGLVFKAPKEVVSIS